MHGPGEVDRALPDDHTPKGIWAAKVELDGLLFACLYIFFKKGHKGSVDQTGFGEGVITIKIYHKAFLKN